MNSWEMKLVAIVRLIAFVFIIISCLPLALFFASIDSILGALNYENQLCKLRSVRLSFLHNLCKSIVWLFQIRIDFDPNASRPSARNENSGAARNENPHPTRVQAGKLILCNHISYLDIIVIGAKFPCVFLAKSEVRNWPLVGFIAKGFGCEFVDRDSLGSRVSTLFKLRKVLQHSNVCVFPEGTTSEHRFPDLKKWNEGQVWCAAAAQNEVLVMGISYKDHPAMIWIDEMTFVPHLFQVLQLPSPHVRLAVAPLESAEATAQVVKAQAARYSMSIENHRLKSRSARAKIIDLCATNVSSHDFV